VSYVIPAQSLPSLPRVRGGVIPAYAGRGGNPYKLSPGPIQGICHSRAGGNPYTYRADAIHSIPAHAGSQTLLSATMGATENGRQENLLHLHHGQ
jgi:hypothetical protein